MASTPVTHPVTLVIQTRVLPDGAAAFESWSQRLHDAVSVVAGFVGQSVIPPSPPIQLDWVITQRFNTLAEARAWMQSEERLRLLGEIQPQLVGPIDIHLFNEGDPHSPAAPVSIVISTRVKPGQQDAFLHWQRRVASIEARFEGFQGYKLEPPIAGVQDEWVMLVRFDTNEHLDAWLESDERRKLLTEAAEFDVDTRVRKVQSGFESWFTSADGSGQSPPAWKENMIVLLLLYPIVFLFGRWVSNPYMNSKVMPFYLALFIGNAVSVSLLGWLFVPRANTVLSWWLNPTRHARERTIAGAALILLLYGAFLLWFANFR
jgi:uncharacterized protein